MSTPSPTQITVWLGPENEEHALYLMSEFFTRTPYTIIDAQEEQATLGTIFALPHKEKRLTLSLSVPVATWQIDDIAFLVKTGLILGFVVRGEIDLGGRVIHNFQ